MGEAAAPKCSVSVVCVVGPVPRKGTGTNVEGPFFLLPSAEADGAGRLAPAAGACAAGVMALTGNSPALPRMESYKTFGLTVGNRVPVTGIDNGVVVHETNLALPIGFAEAM